jgi:hypothetical protein
VSISFFEPHRVNMLLAHRIIASPPKKLSSSRSDSIYIDRLRLTVHESILVPTASRFVERSATAAQRCVRGPI